MTSWLDVGFTGSRTAATPDQADWIYAELAQLYTPGVWLHHGDCVGKDVTAHEYARVLGYRICLHPPSNDRWRAYLDADVRAEPAPYAVRNAAIVRASAVLLACPDLPEAASPRSGTWQTVRLGGVAAYRSGASRTR